MRRRLGRLTVYGGDYRDLLLPRLSYENQGPDFHYIALTIGTKYGDPFVTVELNLGRPRSVQR